MEPNRPYVLSWPDEETGDDVQVYWWISPKGYFYRKYVTRNYAGKTRRISEKEATSLLEEFYNA